MYPCESILVGGGVKKFFSVERCGIFNNIQCFKPIHHLIIVQTFGTLTAWRVGTT